MNSQQLNFNDIAARQIPSLSLTVAAIYTLLGFYHLFFFPPGYAFQISLFAAVIVGVSILVNLTKSMRTTQEHPEIAILLMLILVAAHLFAISAFSKDISQTVNFIVLLCLFGFFFPSRPKFYGSLFCIVTCWLLLVWLISPEISELSTASFSMILAILASLVLHHYRRSQLIDRAQSQRVKSELDDTQQTLENRQNLFAGVLDTVPAAIVVRDSQGYTLMANHQAKELFRNDPSIQPGAFVTPSNLSIVAIDGSPLPDNQLPANRVVEGDLIDNELLAIKFNDGEMVWGLLKSYQMKQIDDSDDVTIISFVDISEQFHAQSKATETESRARTILNSVADGVISVNSQERVDVFNPAAAEITGFSEEEALGQAISSVFKIKLPSVTTSAEFFTAGLKHGIVTRKNGEERRIQLHISRVYERDQKSGWVYVFRDVTEQLRAEQERTTIDKLQSIGVLAGGIAHDFNNLLTSLYGNLELVSLHISDPKEAMIYLESASDSIQQAKNLSTQLLTFAREQPPLLQSTNIEPVILEAARFASSGGEFDISFVVNPGKYVCDIDVGQIQQVINNLVLNAAQASQDMQKIELTLANTTDEHGNELAVFTVSDKGIGISPEDLAHIFEPYFTTKNTGSGLGLASTHSIIANHGGTIDVQSQLGIGTTFQIRLPLSADQMLDNPVTETASETNIRLDILVMDDEEPVLNMLLKLLNHLGHQATGTADGHAAVDAYRSRMESGKKFDLVIMDLTVAKGLGGREATAQILRLDPAARVIVSSGYSSGSEQENYQDHGFTARLNKPYRLEDLRATLIEVAMFK